MEKRFNFRPANWKEIDVDRFLDFLLNYPFKHEYRQLFIDESNVTKGVTPAQLFYTKDEELGVAIVKNRMTFKNEFYSFGIDKAEYDRKNIYYIE